MKKVIFFQNYFEKLYFLSILSLSVLPFGQLRWRLLIKLLISYHNMYWIKTFVFVKNTLKYVIYIELYQFDFLTKISAERFWRILSWLASSINIHNLDKVLKIYFRVLGVILNLNKFKVWPIYKSLYTCVLIFWFPCPSNYCIECQWTAKLCLLVKMPNTECFDGVKFDCSLFNVTNHSVMRSKFILRGPANSELFSRWTVTVRELRMIVDGFLGPKFRKM